MQALFAKLVEVAGGPLKAPLEQFKPEVWMTYKEVVDHHDRIRESACTYGRSMTVNTVRTEIRRYEHEGLTLEHEEHDLMTRMTVTDAGIGDFSKIEFHRCADQEDTYVVYHENLATETLRYGESHILAQIGDTSVLFSGGRVDFTTRVGEDYYHLIVIT